MSWQGLTRPSIPTSRAAEAWMAGSKAGHDMQGHEINFNHPSSSNTWTPCFCASLSLDPAPGPATTISVFADTDPDTFAPSASARALASWRVIFSKVPVNTTVLPDTGEDLDG